MDISAVGLYSDFRIARRRERRIRDACFSSYFDQPRIDLTPRGTAMTEASNHHPSVMFEIIARDQQSLKSFYSKVFGWTYKPGTQGFAYIPFPERTERLLGGIGQSKPGVGLEPGTNFYLQVQDLDAVIRRVVENGGSRHVPPTHVDGYHFAAVKDPEGNVIGLIDPLK
jgi:predicted enzyme related to lactoylglutathione lyase